MNPELTKNFLAEGGEMGALIRAYDWNRTALGSPAGWPQSLKTSIAIMLRSGYPVFVCWGHAMTTFYNNGYIPVMGKKHPHRLGWPAMEVWPEVWDQVGPLMDQVLNKGQQLFARDLLFLIERKGFVEETYFTLSYSPVPNDNDVIEGVFCVCNEETRKVLRQRRLKTLQDISTLTFQLHAIKDVYETVTSMMVQNPNDIPFSLLYVLNEENNEAVLMGHTGFSADNILSVERSITVDGENLRWPFHHVISNGKSVVIDKLSQTFGPMPGGSWKESTESAIILPIHKSGRGLLAGFLVCGISPKLEFDSEYRGFLEFVAGQTSTAIANVRAFEEERKRAEALAEIDKAKTAFLTDQVITRNISQKLASEMEATVLERTSELLKKNEELRRQKEFVETILDSSVDLICVYDNEARFMAMNQKCAEGSRVLKEDAIGKKFEEVYPTMLDSDVHNNLKKALQGQLVLDSIHKSPDTNHIYSNYYVPLVENNEVYGAVVIAHDNTGLIEVTEKFKNANEQLIRTNQELEQFAYIASHDLQEPLRKIQTFSDLFKQNIHDPEQANKYFEKINTSARRMAALIRDVLNYSSLTRHGDQYQQVDLNDIIENVKMDLELLIEEKGVTFYKDKLPVIRGISPQLNQLFSNLISNSIKFSENNPVINISAEKLSGGDLTKYAYLNPSKSYIKLVFQDNGIGFEQQYAEQIFTIFQRLNHRKYTGTGIGLALCKKIVDNHEGAISANSELNKGTMITIILPVG